MRLQPRHADLRSAWARYALALAVFALAFWLRFTLLPVEARLAFATFYPAVVLSLYLAGIGPGVLVMVLGAAAGIYFFSPPYFGWGFDDVAMLAVSGFLLASAMTAWVVHRLRATFDRLGVTLERLAANERTLQNVVNDQTEMLFRFDSKGRFVFANQAGRRSFGLNDESMAGQTWQALVLPDELAGVSERLRQLAPGHELVTTETRFTGPQGETRWGEFVHHAFFDADGRLSEVQTVGRDVTERRQLQEQLAEVSATLQDLYDHAPCGYFSLDAQGRFVLINATALAWLGCSEAEVLGKLGPRDFFTAEGVAEFDAGVPGFMASGHIGPLEFDLASRDGTMRRVSMSATALRDAAGSFVRSRSVMYDVTELSHARRQLRELNRQQAAMLDNELIGIVRLKDRRAVWTNRALERIFGYEPGELVGTSARLLYVDEASFEALGAAAYPVLAAGGTYRTQLRMARKDGQALWVDLSGALISPETGESMWLMLDITAMKEQHERVERAAFHDALTGLPNRILLADRLRQAIPLTARLHSLTAVCFIDLDGFKAVNDRLGHAAGDQLLQVVARRLQTCVRSNDTVARLGGDEFVLLLTHLQSRDECAQVLARVEQVIREPVDLGPGADAQVSASIGVAYCPDDGSDGEQLLKVADQAMYAAKSSARSRAMPA